jgi:hypothetical protein
MHLRACHGVIGVGTVQQGFLPDEVSPSGDAHDAAIAVFAAALEAHQTFADRENGQPGRAAVIDRGVGRESHRVDLRVDAIQTRIVQHAEKCRAADFARRAGQRLRMHAVLAIDRNGLRARVHEAWSRFRD